MTTNRHRTVTHSILGQRPGIRYAVYFRPKYKFRKELYDYSQTEGKNTADLQLLLDKLTLEDYETVYLSRGSADFSDHANYKQYVGDFEEIEFPDPDNKEELIFGTWLPREINIHTEVSCTFIKALRDVESDLRSYRFFDNVPRLCNDFKGHRI